MYICDHHKEEAPHVEEGPTLPALPTREVHPDHHCSPIKYKVPESLPYFCLNIQQSKEFLFMALAGLLMALAPHCQHHDKNNRQSTVILFKRPAHRFVWMPIRSSSSTRPGRPKMALAPHDRHYHMNSQRSGAFLFNDPPDPHQILHQTLPNPGRSMDFLRPLLQCTVFLMNRRLFPFFQIPVRYPFTKHLCLL